MIKVKGFIYLHNKCIAWRKDKEMQLWVGNQIVMYLVWFYYH